MLAACTGTPPLATSPDQPPPYQLGPGDKLKVAVFGEESLSREYVVTSAGDIAFPLLGDIPASGRTGKEVGDVIIGGLAQGYITDPRVSVEVIGYRPFYILGEVQRAGQYPYVTDLSALQAIAIAGGYSYRADRTKLFIRRAGGRSEHTYRLDPHSPVWIMPGDTVRVGERYF